MSAIARRIVVLPEALAPKIPAAGNTRTGLAMPAGVSDRGTPSAASRDASNDKVTSSRYERAFSAVNDSRALGANSSDCELTLSLLQKYHGDGK